MVANGLKKIRPDHRDYDLHKSFGTVGYDISTLPVSYSADAKLTMPNQNISGFPFSCTGQAQADLCTDEDKVVYDPIDTYKNTPPYSLTEGRDLRDSLKVLKSRGPRTKEGVFGAKRTAYYSIKSSGILDWFDAIRVALWITQSESRSSSVGLPWYREFEFVITNDGILPVPADFSSPPAWHNAKIAGWTTLNTKGQLIRGGEAFLMVKSWQGDTYGDKGWCYMSRVLANAVFNISGTGAFTVTKMTPNSVEMVDMNIIARLVSFIRSLLNKYKFFPASNGVFPPLYVAAKEAMGKQMTLDSSVPADLGCAEALSAVLKNAGFLVPSGGIAGTYSMWEWLQKNFQLVSVPQAGDVVISPTGTSTKKSLHGHTGVIMVYGINSNDSNTGLFKENYTLESWKHYYGDILGFPTYFFRPK